MKHFKVEVQLRLHGNPIDKTEYIIEHFILADNEDIEEHLQMRHGSWYDIISRTFLPTENINISRKAWAEGAIDLIESCSSY